ncbi:hypothetical protein PC116_g6746 [Phytophthora cactorum]|uniref:Uncharacterized protein n=1 Tax=Phytophthora cactorum TaxID=29920 RepID=A0A8T1B9L5_9STRA|nr:hypothetical protein Pcac1_g4416 [Phytophthora cactorum]KAG2895694.1 hypothetical protein PC117_g23203 [Phytophthora cactorum]KAG4245465.1 hypothetical protein PC116_g6746 [Phytophthora cactorum]
MYVSTKDAASFRAARKYRVVTVTYDERATITQLQTISNALASGDPLVA